MVSGARTFDVFIEKKRCAFLDARLGVDESTRCGIARLDEREEVGRGCVLVRGHGMLSPLLRGHMPLALLLLVRTPSFLCRRSRASRILCSDDDSERVWELLGGNASVRLRALSRPRRISCLPLVLPSVDHCRTDLRAPSSSRQHQHRAHNACAAMLAGRRPRS